MEISSVDLFKLPVQTLHVRESDKNYLEALEGVKNKYSKHIQLFYKKYYN
jgi:hypothetical protein